MCARAHAPQLVAMADEATGETKPQPKQEGTIINIMVKDQTGAEVHFKVKNHTKLEKVIQVGPCACVRLQQPGPEARGHEKKRAGPRAASHGCRRCKARSRRPSESGPYRLRA